MVSELCIAYAIYMHSARILRIGCSHLSRAGPPEAERLDDFFGPHTKYIRHEKGARREGLRYSLTQMSVLICKHWLAAALRAVAGAARASCERAVAARLAASARLTAICRRCKADLA